jgi:hypothetical protein
MEVNPERMMRMLIIGVVCLALLMMVLAANDVNGGEYECTGVCPQELNALPEVGDVPLRCALDATIADGGFCP